MVLCQFVDISVTTTKEGKKSLPRPQEIFSLRLWNLRPRKKCQNIDLFLVHSMTLDEGELLYEILE